MFVKPIRITALSPLLTWISRGIRFLNDKKILGMSNSAEIRSLWVLLTIYITSHKQFKTESKTEDNGGTEDDDDTRWRNTSPNMKCWYDIIPESWHWFY